MPKAPQAKIGKKDLVHPNSRKAWQLARKEHHETKKEMRRSEANIKLGAQGEKMLWFKENLTTLSYKESYDKSDVLELVKKYLARFDKEQEQIEIVNSIKGRHGRMHASRQDNIRFIQEKESNEFNTAVIPDIFNKDSVTYLRNWTGELRHLCNIQTKAVTLEGLSK